MEQHIFIKIRLEDGLIGLETYQKLVDRYERNALSYSIVSYWRCEFHDGRTDVEDSPKSGRSPNFAIRLHVENALAVFPNGSV
jgi:hypothetical protein